MSLAYFPMYPADFDADTGHLSMAEDGAYNRLLRLSWRCPEGKMPDDLDWICRKARATAKADRALIEAVIAEFFTRKSGKVFSQRLHKEWVAANEGHQRRVLAGKTGGHAKARKAKENAPSIATELPEQCSSNQNQNQNHKEEKKEIGKPISRQSVETARDCVEHFNAVAERAGWPQVQKLTDSRKAALSQRIADVGGVDAWREAMDRAARSPLLTGQTGGNWRADFDWLCKPANFTKLMEGNYDPRPNHPALATHQRGAGGSHDSMVAAFARVARQEPH